MAPDPHHQMEAPRRCSAVSYRRSGDGGSFGPARETDRHRSDRQEGNSPSGRKTEPFREDLCENRTEGWRSSVSTIAPVPRCFLLEPGGWQEARSPVGHAGSSTSWTGEVRKGPRERSRCLHPDDLAAADSRCLSRFYVPLFQPKSFCTSRMSAHPSEKNVTRSLLHPLALQKFDETALGFSSYVWANPKQRLGRSSDSDCRRSLRSAPSSSPDAESISNRGYAAFF